MATRLKTVTYAFPCLTTLADNTLTDLTQITIYLPDSPSAFRSVTAQISCDDTITATGGTVSTKTFGLRLGAAGYTSLSEGSAVTHTSTNMSLRWAKDYTAHFTTNWSGTSMTCDFRLLLDQTTGTTLGWVNVCVTLEITYEYDDTSATQVKTVMIPLNAPEGALTTGATTYDTAPILKSYLAEFGKALRGTYIVLEGNTQNNTATTDHTITISAGSATVTTESYEGALASDRRFRYVWDLTSTWPDVAATQAFQLHASVARCNHLQAYLVCTYEFLANAAATTLTAGVNDSTTTIPVTAAANLVGTVGVILIDNEQMLVTSVASNDLTVVRGVNGTTAAAHSNSATVSPCGTNSIQMPVDPLGSPMGGTTSSDYQRLTSDLWIEEPGPIVAGKIAFMATWEAQQAIAPYFRVGTGSFIAYTDAMNLACGDAAAMVRNDSAFTLARGKNSINIDAYRTTATYTAPGYAFGGYWMVTYVSAKSAAGYGAHNHTVRRQNSAYGSSNGGQSVIFGATGMEIPEADYFVSGYGFHAMAFADGGIFGALFPSIERLAGEGGIAWERVGTLSGAGDNKVGAQHFYWDMLRLFKRWPDDNGAGRMSLTASRRWRALNGAAIGWMGYARWLTYHACGPFTVDGTVTGSNGGTVNVHLCRVSDGQVLKSTSRTGNGAYPTFNWWDNTELLVVRFYEDGTHATASAEGYAAGSA